jgi:hypothetical protein
LSDLIPVSTCETDTDLDTVNDNIDLDNDKDGTIVQNLWKSSYRSPILLVERCVVGPIHFLEQLPRQQLLVQRHLLATVTEVLFLMYQQEKETLLVIK